MKRLCEYCGHDNVEVAEYSQRKLRVFCNRCRYWGEWIDPTNVVLFKPRWIRKFVETFWRWPTDPKGAS